MSINVLRLTAHVALLLLVLFPLSGCNENRERESKDREMLTRQVVLTDAGDQKIQAIKAVREVTGLGLKDAKDIVDSIPIVVISGLSVVESEVVASKLRKAGMTIELRNE